MILRDIWYLAALGRDLRPGALRRKVIAGEPVLLGRRRSGAAFALRDVCPHRAAPLSAGRLIEAGAEATVQCPYHGWTFGTDDGVCRAIPALVDSDGVHVDRIRVPRFPLHEADGLLWIFVPGSAAFRGEPSLPPPDFALPGARPKLWARCHLPVPADHGIVGLVDPAHGPYVHVNWWWRTPTSIHEKSKAFAPSAYGFTMTAHRPSKNSRLYRILGGTPTTEIEFRLPGLRAETVTTEKHTIVSFTAVTPLDEGSSEMTQVGYWDAPFLDLLRPALIPMARGFLNQDGRMFTLQKQGLDYDPNLMLVGEMDRQAQWYFRLKKEWADHKAENRPFVNPIEPQTLRWRT